MSSEDDAVLTCSFAILTTAPEAHATVWA